jgi:hypothetical protein
MYQSLFLDLMKTVYQMFNYEMKLELGVVALNNEIAIVQSKKPQTITLPWHQVYCYTYLVDGVYGALRHLEQYLVILAYLIHYNELL